MPLRRRASTIAARAALILVACAGAPGAALAQPPAAAPSTPPLYSRAAAGTRWLEAPGVAIKVLVEVSNFGGADVEVAEITLDAGSSSVAHEHGSHELIYVLEGVLDHVVNGESHRIEPGMVGIVKQGDTVIHRVVSTTPVKALIVWAPGGEADRLAKMFKTRPVDAAPPASAASAP